MEKKSGGSFARKVRNRKFAIENSWKNDLLQSEETIAIQDITKQEEHEKWTLLHENLEEANASKFYDGYPTISSNGKRFGKVIVFIKRAIRKVIKHTLGWYIFPFYQRFSHFAGKMVNVASLEREFIYTQQAQISKLSATVEDLSNQISHLNEKLQIHSNEVTEKNNYLYTEIQAVSKSIEEIELVKKLFVAKEEQVTDEIILLKKVLIAKEEHLNDEIALIKKLFNTKEAQLSDEINDLQQVVHKWMKDLQNLDKELSSREEDIRMFVNEQVEALKETDLWLNNEMLENRKKVEVHEDYISNETWTEDDNFYHDLEEYFRGERALIKERQEQYVPMVKEHLQDWSKGTFVDIGSGRGEWLDILKENGATDYVGIDINERQNQISRSYGHPVLNEDCVTYLLSLPDNSVDVISGFQIIEHLSRKDLQTVFAQCNRVLKQGGVILFETPNPQNIEVGANTFYLDPTHIKPLNPLYVQYIAERNGFEKVHIIYSSSNFDYAQISKEDKTVFSEQLTNRILGAVNMLYGPKDYCILAIKR